MDTQQRQRTWSYTLPDIRSPSPSPIVQPEEKIMNLVNIDPVEMARQLTIMESRRYQRILPADCLRRVRDELEEQNDNITAMLETNARVRLWKRRSVVW